MCMSLKLFFIVTFTKHFFAFTEANIHIETRITTTPILFTNKKIRIVQYLCNSLLLNREELKAWTSYIMYVRPD